MEDPHEQQQSAILKRVVTNVSKLNLNLAKVNKKIESINKSNADLTNVANVWLRYNDSVHIYNDNDTNKKQTTNDK